MWQGRYGRPDSDILINYVKSTVADADAVRFKVPAYRHPDPLRSPSFLAFGNSQWTIDYSAQSEAQARQKSIAKLKGSAKQVEKAKEHLASDADLHHVSLVLWKETTLAGEKYRWQSKRFEREMSLASVKGLEGVPVARADRFGRASAGARPVHRQCDHPRRCVERSPAGATATTGGSRPRCGRERTALRRRVEVAEVAEAAVGAYRLVSVALGETDAQRTVARLRPEGIA